jgi:hypothetical protein
MRIGAGSYKLCLLLALGIAAPARAELLTARIAAVKTGAGTLRDVTLTLDWPRGAAQGRLSLKATALDFPALSYAATQVAWQCPLLRDGVRHLALRGDVRVKGSAPRQLAVVFAAQGTQAVLTAGPRRLAYSTKASLPDRHEVQLEKIPVAWLSAFLKGLWAEGNWTSGELGGRVTMKTPPAGPFEVGTDLRVTDLNLETPDGLLAAADIKGRLLVDYRDHAGRRSVDTHLVVSGGELLFDSLYTKFPSSPVDIRIGARQQGKAPWTLPRIAWKDPGVLDAKGQASFDAQSSLSDLSLALDFPNLGQARGPLPERIPGAGRFFRNWYWTEACRPTCKCARASSRCSTRDCMTSMPWTRRRASRWPVSRATCNGRAARQPWPAASVGGAAPCLASGWARPISASAVRMESCVLTSRCRSARLGAR